MEPVRLVIWDLDGVFWRGTFSEGGIAYVDAHHALVMTLARRGIMNSICSKNDAAAVEAVLRARGIWEYFIFPSIGWSPKGPRVAALIEAAQLRAASVLFIDDEPMNLAEAAHYAPGVQLAGPELLSQILDDPRFTGRDDAGLMRLAQYRVLEARRAGAAVHGADNQAFLRQSGIEIMLDYDVEANIGRAIELINRTNQLNYTKRRLPEAPEAARRELRMAMTQLNALAALVQVRDRYGDYGFAGFFLVVGQGHQAVLEQFCFSCRVLNMGVERFIYRRLGRPRLTVAGAVACALDEDGGIDWISVQDKLAAVTPPAAPKILDRLVIRGGCDLDAMSHYLRGLADEFHLELNTARAGRQFRIDNAMFLHLLFDELPYETREALQNIGYMPSDWTSALALPVAPGSRTVWMLSFWTDAFVYLYKHRKLDVALPFLMEGDPKAGVDVTFMGDDEVRGLLAQEVNRRAHAYLKANFLGVGMIFEDLLRAALARLLAAAEDRAMVIIILAPESWRALPDGTLYPRPAEARFNNWVREAVAGAANVHLVEFGAFVPADAAYKEMFHYDRLVYMRAAEHICGIIKAKFEK